MPDKPSNSINAAAISLCVDPRVLAAFLPQLRQATEDLRKAEASPPPADPYNIIFEAFFPTTRTK
jgi:hypothetical protein